MDENTEFLGQNEPETTKTDDDIEVETVVTTQKRKKKQKSTPDEINNYLSTLPASWKVSIDRLSPHWASGHCGHMEIDPSDPFDIEQIKEEWGGHRLRLRILDEHGNQKKQTTIRFAEPPRREGELMKRYQEETPDRRPNSEPTFATEMMKMVMAQQAAQSELTATLLKDSLHKAEPPPPPESPKQNSPMAPLRDAMKFMKEMEGILPQGASDGSDGGMLGSLITPEVQGMFGQLLTMYFQNQMKMQEMHIKNAAQQNEPRPPPQRVIANPPQPIPQQRPQQRPQPQTMSDEDLFDELGDRFQRMSPEQRKRAMGSLLGDSEYVDFEEYEDDNFDEEPLETSPAANSENDTCTEPDQGIPSSDSSKVTLRVDLGTQNVEGNDFDGDAPARAGGDYRPPGFGS